MTLKGLVRRAAAMAGVHLSPIAFLPERTLLGLAKRDIRLILDVGANEGQFAADMRRLFPAACIVSFEPTPQAFAILQLHARDDPLHIAVNCALGETPATLTMHLHEDHTPSSSLLDATAKSHELFPQTKRQTDIQVSLQRLDDVVAELELQPNNGTLLKLDVQGYEEHVLAGGQTTLAQVGACIAEVCLEQLYQDQAKFAAVQQACAMAGLEYAGNISQVYGGDGRVSYLDAVFIRPGLFQR